MADSTFQAVAEIIIPMFNAEFSPIVMIPDALHESLGRTRIDVGISPLEDVVRESNAVVQETMVQVQFFDLWTQEISPETQVNPYRITAFADQFRNMLRTQQATDPGTGQLWFFEIRKITYGNDPTGNKTRFVATIRAWGNNSGLVETIG